MTMTSTHISSVCRDPKAVERRLEKVCKQLNVEEVNIGMFHHMIRSGVATNDVRSFATNQQFLNRQANRTTARLSKVAMKQKLNDACSTANGLRKEKKRLKDALTVEFNYSRARTKKVVKRIMSRANNCKNRQKIKVRKKFLHCKKKMVAVNRETEKEHMPGDVWNVLKDVNVFNQEISPEPPAEPMICDKQIKLSSCEMAFLKRGPKFMLRPELNETDFAVDLHKMVIKEKYDKMNSESGDVSPEDEEEERKKGPDESRVDGLIQRLDAKARLVFDKGDKSLDLGRLTATDYKFNRFIYLPKPESSMRESLHEVRKDLMMNTFRKFVEREVTRSQSCKDGAERRMNAKINSLNSDKKIRACPAKYECSNKQNSSLNKRACPAIIT